MNCEQSATWTFRPSGGKGEVRARIAIVFQIPIPREEDQDLASVSVLASWELFPEELPWEMMDTLRSAVVNGFHDGFTFVDLPIPPGGIDIEVTALEIEPSPVNLDATDVQRLSGTLEWVAAGMAVSCWRGLHELSADASA